MIRSYLIVVAVSAVATMATVPLMIRLSHRFGAVAYPNDRRVHTSPTPRLGGGAMFLGVIAGFVTASLLGGFRVVFEDSTIAVLGVIAASTVMFGVGAVDDVREVSAPAKVAGIVLAGSLLVWSGVSIVNLPLPYLGFTVLSPDLSVLVTVVFVLILANAVNLIDGLDGLATGVMAIASGSFLLYSIKLNTASGMYPGNPGPLIAAVTLGICLGFLVWNFHPAKVFMGDSGALLLGLLMASASVAVGGQSDQSFTGQSWFFFAPIVIPLLILGVPLFDMAFAIVRRTTRGTGFATADKDHLHHRLMRLGHGHRIAVVILWAWTALLSAFALVPAITGKARGLIAIGVGALVLGLFTMLWPTIGRRRQERADDESISESVPASRDAEAETAESEAADTEAADTAATDTEAAQTNVAGSEVAGSENPADVPTANSAN